MTIPCFLESWMESSGSTRLPENPVAVGNGAVAGEAGYQRKGTGRGAADAEMRTQAFGLPPRNGLCDTGNVSHGTVEAISGNGTDAVAPAAVSGGPALAEAIFHVRQFSV